MGEIKDKVVTVESLSALHEYNKAAYMKNVVDISDMPMKYNPSEFTGFIMEFDDYDNANIKRCVNLTNILRDNEIDTTTAQSFHFDMSGNVLLYELVFSLSDEGYVVNASLHTHTISTGITKTKILTYNKIYGIKYL